jgi:hypothetical protein
VSQFWTSGRFCLGVSPQRGTVSGGARHPQETAEMARHGSIWLRKTAVRDYGRWRFRVDGPGLGIHREWSIATRICGGGFDLLDRHALLPCPFDEVPAALGRDQCVRSIRSLKRFIAMYAIFLACGILATQGGPLLPRAVGATIDILILAACAQSLVRLQKRLKQLPADPARGPLDVK